MRPPIRGVSRVKLAHLGQRIEQELRLDPRL
jgi:hypothetical protein